MKHLQRTTCCDHTFTANDIQGRIMSQREALGSYDPKLYGGTVKQFAKAECPACQTPYMLWMYPKGRNYHIVTMSEIEAADKEDKKPKKPTSAAQ